MAQAKRAVLVLISIVFASCAPVYSSPGAEAPCSFDLLEISYLEPKGRIQDNPTERNAELVEALVQGGSRSIPCLIERLGSEHRYDKRVILLSSDVFEGDIALVYLDDLFRDPSGKLSSLPDLCWDNLLGARETRISPHGNSCAGTVKLTAGNPSRPGGRKPGSDTGTGSTGTEPVDSSG